MAQPFFLRFVQSPQLTWNSTSRRKQLLVTISTMGRTVISDVQRGGTYFWRYLVCDSLTVLSGSLRLIASDSGRDGDKFFDKLVESGGQVCADAVVEVRRFDARHSLVLLTQAGMQRAWFVHAANSSVTFQCFFEIYFETSFFETARSVE